MQKDKLDLPFVKLSKVSRATENFSAYKKLGEGGYGPVYKVRKMQKKSNQYGDGREKQFFQLLLTTYF